MDLPLEWLKQLGLPSACMSIATISAYSLPFGRALEEQECTREALFGSLPTAGFLVAHRHFKASSHSHAVAILCDSGWPAHNPITVQTCHWLPEISKGEQDSGKGGECPPPPK